MEVLKKDYPDDLYPLKELGKELSYEVARLKSICKAQKIEVTSDSGVTYIPIGAKEILENIVSAKRQGKKVSYESSSTTTPIQKESVKKIKPPKTDTASGGGLALKDGLSGINTPEEFVSALVKVMEVSQTTSTTQSPLQIQRELKDAADNGFLLNGEQVANIFGIKKSSVSSWKTGHRRLGFEFEKIKEGNKTLWKSRQY
tara:strand:- start:242 stop:844 length:603 start_codon:yes stop_codon:yes gene_type:complete